ncbi:MAG TPA: hypothetical protein VK029_09125 [Pseudogracilibacillus sp.]|nr:hypothetical protein [Pseudogracilibacillus sp.]
MQVTFGGTNKEVWDHSLFALPAFLGGYIGQFLLNGLVKAPFKFLSYILEMVTGTNILVTGI